MAGGLREREGGFGRRGGPSVLRASTDDSLPPEVPTLVVRFQSPAHPLLDSSVRLPRAHVGQVPIHRRGTVGAPGPRLSGCRSGSEPLAAAGEVAAGRASLRRAVLPR